MPAQVGHQGRQAVIVKAVEQLCHMRLTANVRDQSFAPRRTALISEHRKIGIGTIFNPVLKRFSTRPRERRALQLAVLQRNNTPAAGFENIIKAPEHAVRGRAVQ